MRIIPSTKDAILHHRAGNAIQMDDGDGTAWRPKKKEDVIPKRHLLDRLFEGLTRSITAFSEGWKKETTTTHLLASQSNEIMSKITESLEKLGKKESPCQWEFQIQYNSAGDPTRIVANPVTSKKPQ